MATRVYGFSATSSRGCDTVAVIVIATVAVLVALLPAQSFGGWVVGFELRRTLRLTAEDAEALDGTLK